MALNCTGVDFANPGCVTIMSNFCRVDEPLGDTYLEKWQGDEFTSDCRAFAALNAGNQAQYAPVVDAYVRRYLVTDGNSVTYPQQGSLIYDPAIEDVIDVCSTYPGGCDAVLTQVCNGFTRADLKSNPNLGKLCGCFMADLQYDKYAGTFGVSKQCDPACTLQSAVHRRDVTNQFNFLECGQTICIIDDVKIQLLNNTVAGDISFGQACSSCGTGGSCQCVISDISVTAVESSIANINFDQQCGGNPLCYKSNAQGIPELIDCSLLEDNNSSGSVPSRIPITFIIIAIAVLAAIVVIIIAISIFSSRKKSAQLDYGSFSPRPSYSNASPLI